MTTMKRIGGEQDEQRVFRNTYGVASRR
jgi:hypothetical protein